MKIRKSVHNNYDKDNLGPANLFIKSCQKL